MHAVQELAAGVSSLPSAGSAFAATQATWRFLNNQRVALSALAEPLRAVGRARANESQGKFVLLIHDWCKLKYDHLDSKHDLAQLTHADDVGYDLTTALLASGSNGEPWAPMEMHLRTALGVLSTRHPAPRPVHHLDQLLPTMKASLSWGLTQPIVHVIDREADSVDRYRQWDAAGFHFLIRGDDRRVCWAEKSCLLSEIRDRLRRDHHFRNVGEARYHDRPTPLWVAETDVVLDRPAKKSVGGRKFNRPGRPLPLRLVFVQLRDDRDQVLADWWLLSNVPREWATSEHLARCYYWRWRIESFFKLLKSHGQQLEQWQQESGPAIARRLLIAAMACVVVWQLQADQSPAAIEFKNVLVRLSGRQMKRSRPHTAPALLAGLWVLLSTLALLQHCDLHHLQGLVAQVPYLHTG